MARFDLSDAEWLVIEPLLSKRARCPTRRDDRVILNGILYILRTSAPWRDLPARYSPHTTVYNRYVRWGERGVWKDIFDTLAEECEDAPIFIDDSIVKAHHAAARSKKGNLAKNIGRSRGGRTSKVHVAVDQKGRPIRLAISGGHVHDSKLMPDFLDWEVPPLAIVANKAYSSHKIRKAIADEGALAVIPTKSNTKKPPPHNKNLYVRRNIVERFFCKMKDNSRLATRLEKKGANFLNMLFMLSTKCWIN
ncbi:IS5 family transposase [Kiloniella sp.]|uniref:IS5 family transposase n=1 Tax=Kiloniella sp. TaxID=1938587 RepID=UPI003A8D8E96